MSDEFIDPLFFLLNRYLQSVWSAPRVQWNVSSSRCSWRCVGYLPGCCCFAQGSCVSFGKAHCRRGWLKITAETYARMCGPSITLSSLILSEGNIPHPTIRPKEDPVFCSQTWQHAGVRGSDLKSCVCFWDLTVYLQDFTGWDNNPSGGRRFTANLWSFFTFQRPSVIYTTSWFIHSLDTFFGLKVFFLLKNWDGHYSTIPDINDKYKNKNRLI